MNISFCILVFQVDLQLLWEAFAILSRSSTRIHTILLQLCHQLLTCEEVYVMELPFERLSKGLDNSSSQVPFG